MENTTPETKSVQPGKKKATLIIAIIAGVLAVAALLIFLIIPAIRYGIAMGNVKKGNYIDGYETLASLGKFGGSDQKAADVYPSYLSQKLHSAQIGEKYTFGTYEQDGKPATENEAISWIVIAKEDGKALLLSEYALDSVPYNTLFASASWETCTLRPWLNDDFLNAAFTEKDQSIIATTTVSADENPTFSTDPGADTQDKLFLLSISEVDTYKPDNAILRCQPTNYAVNNGIWTDREVDDNCRWWLRSPGINPSDASAVGPVGFVYGQGNYVFFSHYGVRPAMWINTTP